MSFMKEDQSGRESLGDVLPSLSSLSLNHASTEVGRVLVTSGSGVLGYRVAMSLLEAGHRQVRIGIFQSEKERADEGCAKQCQEAFQKMEGAEVVDFDWTNEEDFDEALKDVTTVFCTIPHVDGWQDLFPKFVRKCMYKRVEHFVKLSFLRPPQSTSPRNSATTPSKNGSVGHGHKSLAEIALEYRDHVPFCRFHATCDDYLMQMARQPGSHGTMAFTILASSHLMTTPLFFQGKQLREKCLYVTASYGMGINYVSPNDVADAAVVIILKHEIERGNENNDPSRRTEQQIHRAIYNITGPGPTTDAEVAKLLSDCFQRPIQHLALGYHEYVEHFKKRGLPAWQVKDSAAMERMKAMGYDEIRTCYTSDFKQLTGKQPESFGEFLKHQACMRPGMAFP